MLTEMGLCSITKLMINYTPLTNPFALIASLNLKFAKITCIVNY